MSQQNFALSLALLIIASLAIYLITGYTIFAVLVGITETYFILRKILSPTYFQTKFFILVTSLLAYMGLLQISSYSLWLISSNLDISYIPFVVLSIASVMCITIFKKVSPKLPLIKYGDVASLSAAIIFVSFVSILPLWHAKTSINGNVLNLINVSEDDPVHVSILNDHLQYKKAVLTQEVNTGTARQGSDGYPSGWHIANAINILAVNPTPLIGLDSVSLYVISKLFWAGILVYLLGAASASLLPISKKSILVSYSVLLLTLLFSVWFITDSIESGFYNYIGILCVVPVFILSMAQLAGSSTLKKCTEGLILPIVLTSIVSLSWILAAPMFIITAIIIFFRTINIKDIKHDITSKEMTVPILTILLLIVPLIVSTLLQLSLITGNSASASNTTSALLMSGGIQIYPIGFFVALIIGSVPFLYILFHDFNKDKRIATPMESYLTFITVSFIFVAIIYMIQMFYTQSLEYYFYKSLNIIILTVMIGIITGSSYLISQSNLPNIVLWSLITIGVASSVVILYPEPNFFNYTRNNHHTYPSITKLIEKELVKSQNSKDYFLSKNIVAISNPEGSPIVTGIAMKMLRSNRPYSKCYQSLQSLFIKTPSNLLQEPDLLSIDCDGYNVSVYTDSTDADRLNGISKQAEIKNMQFLPLP